MDEPPPPVVAGQLKEHPDGPFRKTVSLEPGHHLWRSFVRDDHLDPRVACRSRLTVAGDLVIDALARAADRPVRPS